MLKMRQFYLLLVWNIDFINIPIEIYLQNRY